MPLISHVDLALENFKKDGVDVLMSGRLGASIRFYYMDTNPILKMVAENSERPRYIDAADLHLSVGIS